MQVLLFCFYACEKCKGCNLDPAYSTSIDVHPAKNPLIHGVNLCLELKILDIIHIYPANDDANAPRNVADLTISTDTRDTKYLGL